MPAPIRAPDRAALERKALRHIGRYETSAAHLAAVLRRFLARHGMAEEAWIQEIVAKLVERKLVDDRRFAEIRGRSLKRRGTAKSLIRQDLSARGVAPEDADGALGALEEEIGEREAAENYARRRRLGPHRPQEKRAEFRLKDMAALARRGFSPEIARAVIDGAQRD